MVFEAQQMASGVLPKSECKYFRPVMADWFNTRVTQLQDVSDRLHGRAYLHTACLQNLCYLIAPSVHSCSDSGLNIGGKCVGTETSGFQEKTSCLSVNLSH